MMFELKAAFTFAALCMCLFIYFRPENVVSSNPRRWMGGESDLVRNMIFDKNGKTRKLFRHVSILWITIIVSLMWAFA